MMDPIMSQMNPVQTFTHYLPKSILILSSKVQSLAKGKKS